MNQKVYPEESSSKVYNNGALLECRRFLRKNGTSAEATLWRLLKGKQMMGLKFRRQYSVGSYILDFYCPTIRLGIELDGADHFTMEGLKYDEGRTYYLSQMYDISILRFENMQVFDSALNIKNEIERVVRQRMMEMGL